MHPIAQLTETLKIKRAEKEALKKSNAPYAEIVVLESEISTAAEELMRKKYAHIQAGNVSWIGLR